MAEVLGVAAGTSDPAGVTVVVLDRAAGVPGSMSVSTEGGAEGSVVEDREIYGTS